MSDHTSVDDGRAFEWDTPVDPRAAVEGDELAHAALIVAARVTETKAPSGPKPLSFLTRRPNEEWLLKIAPSFGSEKA